jgi:hypothetical protein
MNNRKLKLNVFYRNQISKVHLIFNENIKRLYIVINLIPDTSLISDTFNLIY